MGKRKIKSKNLQMAKKRSAFDMNAGFSDPAEHDQWDKIYAGSLSLLTHTDLESQVNSVDIPHQKAKAASFSRESVFDDDREEAVFLPRNTLPDVAHSKAVVAVDQSADTGPMSLPKRKSAFEREPSLSENECIISRVADDCASESGVKRSAFDAAGHLPEFMSCPSGVQTAQNSVDHDLQEEKEDDKTKNLALRLAEDFCRKETIISVDDALYFYNGIFYSLLQEEDAKRRIFKRYRREVSQASTLSVLQNSVDLLRYCVTERYETFPVNENLIVFENGTLDVHTRQFRRNSPRDLVTSALGIRYNPTRKDMPATQYFLETIANGDSDLYERMLQVIGYILSNDVKAKSFIYLEGVGDAGKSRFCDLIASFFPQSGPNKVTRIALQDLGGKFALGNLVNAKLNISEDLPDSPLTPTTVSRIKMISDGNRLEAEAKYVQPFSFRPLCKLLFASNHPLRIKEYDAAFVNRVVYLPFQHPIPREKQDRNILWKMQGELPALFNYAFAAYRRLVASGYAWAGMERFTPDIRVVHSGLRTDKEQVLQRFVSECLELEKDVVTATSDLQTAYNHFCSQHAYLPIAGDRFSRELFVALPSSVERTKIGNQRRGFKGVRLKADWNTR